MIKQVTWVNVSYVSFIGQFSMHFVWVRNCILKRKVILSISVLQHKAQTNLCVRVIQMKVTVKNLPIRIQDLWVQIERNRYVTSLSCFVGPSTHPQSKHCPIRSTGTSKRRLKKLDWSQEMFRYRRKLLASLWRQRSSGRIHRICVYRSITFSEFLMWDSVAFVELLTRNHG